MRHVGLDELEDRVQRAFAAAASRAVFMAATVALGVSACGSDSEPVQADPLDGVTAELIITRQRDLIDRGLINVRTRNESGEDLLLTERQLIATFFVTTPSRPRTTSLRTGRQVAIQVPFGTVENCESSEPVKAALAVEFTDAQGAARAARIPVAGTDILDSIRARQCAAIAVDTQTELELTDAFVTSDGDVSALLGIVPVRNGRTIEITDVAGTVLVAAEAPAGSLPGEVGAGTLRIPLTFSVNRCDPHALAEVTKRFGLDLYVSIDGGSSERVPVDVGALTSAFEDIVQMCVERTG